MEGMEILHTAGRANLNPYIDGEKNEKRRLIVVATGRNVQPSKKGVFIAWVDDQGKLHCEFDKAYENNN